MTVDAAKEEVLVGAGFSRRATQHRDSGPVDPAHEREQRRQHSRNDPGQDAEHADRGEADDGELRIAGVDPPELPEAPEVDEPDHRSDDDRPEASPAGGRRRAA